MKQFYVNVILARIPTVGILPRVHVLYLYDQAGAAKVRRSAAASRDRARHSTTDEFAQRPEGTGRRVGGRRRRRSSERVSLSGNTIDRTAVQAADLE